VALVELAWVLALALARAVVFPPRANATCGYPGHCACDTALHVGVRLEHCAFTPKDGIESEPAVSKRSVNEGTTTTARSDALLSVSTEKGAEVSFAAMRRPVCVTHGALNAQPAVSLRQALFGLVQTD
jgi:hypothetical protein